MTGPTLPPGFEALEPFVERWAISNTGARMARRIESTPEELAAFVAAATPLLDPALAHLDGRPLDELDAADTRLLGLVLSLAHAALAVEQQRDLEPHHSRLQAHFRLERSTEDFGTTPPSATR